MGSKFYKASAPGSLMLMGEHAVLHGHSALVCAIEPRLSVELHPRTDRQFTIQSSLFPLYHGYIDELTLEGPYRFILAVIRAVAEELKSGFDLHVFSELSHQQGLGSSAAVTVAALRVITHFLDHPFSKKELLTWARNVIREVQGCGSGSDIAASVYGGVISYDPDSLIVEKLAENIPLTCIYSGSKVPTSTVIKQVEILREQQPLVVNKIFELMQLVVEQAKPTILKKDWKTFGELMNIHQGLQESLGVSTALLSELIYDLRQHSVITGAKISGSGLGDSVIGLGEIAKDYFPKTEAQRAAGVQPVSIKIAAEGVRDEAN